MKMFDFAARAVPALAGTALLISAAAPAWARAENPVPAAKASAEPAPATKPAEVRYCQVWVPTGSYLPRKDCRTRAEWIRDEGIDPAAPKH